MTNLNAQVNSALASPSLREKVAAFGYQVAGGTPEQFGAYIKADVAKWSKLIREACGSDLAPEHALSVDAGMEQDLGSWATSS